MLQDNLGVLCCIIVFVFIGLFGDFKEMHDNFLHNRSLGN